MKHLITVKLINADTKEEEILYKREGTDRCRFKKWITYRNYRIQLRLDYNGSLDETPILDADIYDIATNKPIPRDAKCTWHHTTLKRDQSNKVYSWKFERLELNLSMVTTWALGFTMDFITRKQGDE